MSVGHLARLIEEAGISTVSIAVRAFKPRMEPMNMPRLLLTEHMMGRPIGAPHNRVRQREVVDAALALLESASAIGTVVELDGKFRPK